MREIIGFLGNYNEKCSILERVKKCSKKTMENKNPYNYFMNIHWIIQKTIKNII